MIIESENCFPSPPKLREAIMSNIKVPVVFKKQIKSWNIPWTVSDLSKKLGDCLLDFRVVPKSFKGIPWEGQAKFVEASISNFISWQNEDIKLDVNNPFIKFTKNEYWAYSSYNHMKFVFSEDPNLLQAIDWGVFGFPEITGKESTFWLGCKDACTPCHNDSYGCNLVAQVLGRKKWILFPPEDSDFMYPTRIPYEESSVYSSVDISSPDLSLHPLFKKSNPYVVVLEPGDVLFVPKKWWHFVSNLDDITMSINAWIKLDTDCDCRLEEGVTRILMSSLISYCEPEGETWLNPKEELVSSEETLQYLVSTLREVCKTKKTSECVSSTNATKMSKTHEGMDVHSQSARDTLIDIHSFEIVKKVNSRTFSELYAESNQMCSSQYPTQEITLKKVVNSLVHPKVIQLICKLLQEA